jgi:hypothetical protein
MFTICSAAQIVQQSLSGRLAQPRFSAWQAGKDSLKSAFRACWPLLARLCSHSENPIRQETIPFRTSAWIARKEGKTVVLEDVSRGPSACRMASILSKTAGARGETKVSSTA